MEKVIIPKPGSEEKIVIGPGQPLVLIAGPCVIESPSLCREIAQELICITDELGIDLIFKASFDKANRTSLQSFRGPGMEKGLQVLADIRTLGVPVISDLHEPGQAPIVAEVLDVLQIPAFLSRQTDLLVAAAKTGKPINLKKGQFLSPWDMRHAVRKIRESANAAPRSATTTWWWTCARCRSCVLSAARSFTTPPTACSCPAVPTAARAASASSFRL